MKSSAEIVRTAWKRGVVVPAFNMPYLPMLEPVVRATRDQDAVAFVTVARLEWVKFESRSLSAVMEEYKRWQDPRHVRLHLDHVPVIDEDHQQVDVLAIIKEAIALKASVAVAVAQEAVYARTAELIRDYFGIQGLRAALME